jgi:hypothetical protein
MGNPSPSPPPSPPPLSDGNYQALYGAVPCGFQALIYQAMKTDAELLLELTIAFAQYGKVASESYAQTLGAQVRTAEESAKKQQEATTTEAIGSLIGGSISLGLAAFSGITMLRTTSSELTANKTAYENFGKKLNEPLAGNTEIKGSNDLVGQKTKAMDAVDEAREGPMSQKDYEALQAKVTEIDHKIARVKKIENRIEEISKDRAATDKFIKDREKKAPGSQGRKDDDEVIEHMKGTDDTALKTVRAHHDALTRENSDAITAENQSRMSEIQMAQMTSQGAEGISTGTAKIFAAEDQAMAAQLTAYAQAIEANNNLLAAAITNAQQSSNTNLGDANQAVTSFGGDKV